MADVALSMVSGSMTHLARAWSLVGHLSCRIVTGGVDLLALLGRRRLRAEIAGAWVARCFIFGTADAVEGCRAHAASAVRGSDVAEVARISTAGSFVRRSARAPIGHRTLDSLLVRASHRAIGARLACAVQWCGLSARAEFADRARDSFGHSGSLRTVVARSRCAWSLVRCRRNEQSSGKRKVPLCRVLHEEGMKHPTQRRLEA